MDNEPILDLEQTLTIVHSIKEWKKMPKQEKFQDCGEMCFEYEKILSYQGMHRNFSLLAQYQHYQGSWMDYERFVGNPPFQRIRYNGYNRKYYVLSVFKCENKLSEYSDHAFPHNQIEYSLEAERNYRERIREVYRFARRKEFFKRFI